MICYNEGMNMKNYIQINSLPRVIFAHVFRAETYQNRFDFPDLPYTMLEITYVSEGKLCFELTDGTRLVVGERSVICNPYNSPLRVYAPARHEHHTVCCRLPFRSLPLSEIDPDGERPQGLLSLPFVTPPLPENNPILPLIDEIISTHTMHTKGPLYCSGLVLQLLDRLDRLTRTEEHLPAYHHRKYVKQAKEYIFEHLRDPIRQTDIAAHLGISSEYLCSVFKKVEGIPIIPFINRIKLEQIRTLMETGRLTLAEASELYGYTDPNYVSRLHKKYFHFNITDIKKGRAADGSPPTGRALGSDEGRNS